MKEKVIRKYKAGDLVYLPSSTCVWSEEDGVMSEKDNTPQCAAEIATLEATLPDGYESALYTCGFVKAFDPDMVDEGVFVSAIRVGWGGQWYIATFPISTYCRARAHKVLEAPEYKYDEWAGEVTKILSAPFPDMRSALTALKFFGGSDE